MKDDPFAPPADAGGDNNTPTPPAPDVPAVPDAPTPPANDDNKLSVEEQQEADEWEKATDELFPGLKKTEDEKDKKTDEQADKTTKTPETPAAGEDGKKPSETPDGKSDDVEEDDDESAAPTDASARLNAREQQASVDSLKNEIREKMFKDTPTEIRAPDGDLIDSVEKLMQYRNDATGEAFTREEATLWLAQAERQLDNNVKDMNSQIESIAETQLDIKDQADVVNYSYGELLKAMPELREKLWKEYEKTLEKDPKSGIITKAKVSLQSFYETALEPYAELGRKLESESTQAAADTQAAEQATKQQQEQERQKKRQDRSDIYGAGKVDTQTEEDAEWSKAAEAVFGPLK